MSRQQIAALPRSAQTIILMGFTRVGDFDIFSAAKLRNYRSGPPHRGRAVLRPLQSRRRGFRFHPPAPLSRSFYTDECASADLHYSRALPNVQQIIEGCARDVVIRTKLLDR